MAMCRDIEGGGRERARERAIRKAKEQWVKIAERSKEKSRIGVEDLWKRSGILRCSVW